MRGNAVRWPLVGGVVVLVGVAVLGGVALSNVGPASAAVGAQADDTDWNTTNGSDGVADDCPPGDALRKEVYDGLEDRSIEEVRSVIPEDAVRCLPSDVRDVLELENETDGNGTDGDDSADGEDCPSPDAIRAEVDAKLVTSSKAEVRADLSEDEIACLPADVIDQLDIGTGAESGTDDSNDSSSGGVECPSDAEMRVAVETALAEGSATTVREQIPDDYRDCLSADVKDQLGIGDDAANTSTRTDTATETEDATETETEGVDCPPPETIREEVNRTLERMPAAQFRTMVPEDYVECFPSDVRERLGLTASAGTDSDGETPADASASVDDSGSAGADPGGAGGDGDSASTASSDDLTDSDGDGVPDRYDYAPRDPDVQSKSDVQAGDDPGSDDGSGGSGDEIPVAAGSALLLVLAVGVGAIVYRRYGGPSGGADDQLPRPSESVVTGETSAQPHSVFGESAFDPDGAAGSGTEFTFDDHGDDSGFVFDNDADDEDVITLDSDGAVADEAVDAGFVFEGGPDPELDEAGEPADD